MILIPITAIASFVLRLGPWSYPIAIALRRSRGIDDARVTKNETPVRRVSSGFTSLDEQAKALGVHRATASTIIKNKHKLGRLSNKTIKRIVMNPETPPLVLAVIQEYVAQRSMVRMPR